MIIGKEELGDLRSDFKDQTIALRLGCYDILHYGHQKGIESAASRANLLVVGVMPDRYVRAQKGENRPINPAEKRVEAVDNADGVAYSFIAGAGRLAVAHTILRLRPDVYVEGAEHGQSLMRAAFLRAIEADYAIDDEKVASSSQLISRFGPLEAAKLSALNFHPEI